MTNPDVIIDANRLIEGHETLLQVVGRVESNLVSPNTGRRNDAIKFLSDVLLLLPLSYPNDLEISTLIRFFTARLDTTVNDNASTSSCLKAIFYLSKCDQFKANENVVTVVNVVLKDVAVQSLAQEVRYLVFKLMQYYLDTFREALRQCESDFVVGFIKAAEAEKDPRNLTVIFDTFSSITSTFTINYLAEDLFELISCYFPVDFRQRPVDEDHGITPAKLSEQLLECLTGNEAFAPFCYQLIIDNFAECEDNFEPLIILLERALGRFKADQIGYYEEKLTFCLRSVITKTVILANDLVYKCIRQLVKDSQENFVGEQDNNTILETNPKSLNQFLKDAGQFLSSNDSTLRNVGIKLISSLIDINTGICRRICSKFLFMSLEKCLSMQLEFRLVYAQVLCILLDTLARFRLKEFYSECRTSLDSFINDRLLNETEIHLLSIWLSCASCILQLDPEVFSDKEITSIVHKCADFLSDSVSDEFRRSVIKFLQSVGHQKFNFVRKACGNSFSDSKIWQLCPMFVVNNDTAALCLPSILSPCFDFVKNSDELSLKLNLLQELERCLEYQQNNEFKIDILSKVFHYVVKIHVFVDDLPDQCDTKIIIRLADLAQDLMISASSFSSSESQLLDLILLEMSNYMSNIRYSVLFDRILATISLNSTNRFIDTIDRILNAMDNYLESNDRKVDAHAQYYSFYGRCIASAVCKLEKDHPIMSRITDDYYSKLKVGLNDVDPTVVLCFGFLCKSLLMRNLTPFAGSCLQQLLEFAVSTGFPDALKLIEDLFHEDKRFLNSNLHCICAPLYIQRVFTYCTTFIARSLEEHVDEPTDVQKNNCQILGLVLSNVPFNKHTSGQIGKLLSILVGSLKSTRDLSILKPILSALEHLLSTKEETILDKLSDYLPALIGSLCELSVNISDMNLRIASLRCLSKIAVTVSTSVLSKHKNFVLKTLTTCLDDPKRLVRKEATGCKNRWCLL